MSDVNLTEWARLQGIHPQMAYRWFRKGMPPVPAVPTTSRSALIAPHAAITPAQGGTGPYARVYSHDHRADQDRQMARLRCAARDIDPTSPEVVS